MVTVTEPLETAVQPEAFSEEPEVQVTESVKTLKNLKDDVLKEYWGPNIRGTAYSESKGYLIMYDYEEEMVNTDDGWKFSVYNDYRRG